MPPNPPKGGFLDGFLVSSPSGRVREGILVPSPVTEQSVTLSLWHTELAEVPKCRSVEVWRGVRGEEDCHNFSIFITAEFLGYLDKNIKGGLLYAFPTFVGMYEKN